MTYIAPQLAAGWTLSGACEWMIDDAGKLTVRPTAGLTRAKLADWGMNPPWSSKKASIKSAVIEPGVVAATCKDMFLGCSNMTSIDLSGLDTSEVTDMSGMFNYCISLSSLDVSGFDTSRVENMYRMFRYCEALTSLDVSDFDGSSVKSIGFMFYQCGALKTLNLGAFNPCAATDMQGVFASCSALGSLDLSGFSAAAATNMSSMFSGCGSLAELDLRSFDTSHVTDMSSMFEASNTLRIADLSSFDTSAVTDARNMFNNAHSLRAIYAGAAFALPASADSGGMFGNCYALMGRAGTAYDPAHADPASARLDGGATAPGYFADRRGDVSGNSLVNIVDAQVAYDIARGMHAGLPGYAAMCSRADVTGTPGGGPDGCVYAEDAFAIQYAALHGWDA